ncbi:hypothetical protein Ae505Ps2_6238 [Pseudonocardia sp. Ae505_Ps2]|nr:hypothetical protein Ae505Ps2_6238 [Pseudonocardia sp. Ae505_Ps2]
MTEEAIDRLYGDLLHDHDDPDSLGESSAEASGDAAGLVVFFSPRVLAGQARVAGGEAA